MKCIRPAALAALTVLGAIPAASQPECTPGRGLNAPAVSAVADSAALVETLSAAVRRLPRRGPLLIAVRFDSTGAPGLPMMHGTRGPSIDDPALAAALRPHFRLRPGEREEAGGIIFDPSAPGEVVAHRPRTQCVPMVLNGSAVLREVQEAAWHEPGFDGGQVVVRIQVDRDGRSSAVELRGTTGYPMVDEAVRRAARRMRFRPAQVGDFAVRAWVEIPIVIPASES